MGDYNIACFISGLSIGNGDLYYIIPLFKNTQYNQRNTPTNHYDIFKPATLPILCKYDNCGRGDVIENDHTRYLEKRFKMPIADIVDDCNRKCFDNFCYVHKGVFDAMQQYYVNYSGQKKQMYNYEKELDKYIQHYRRKLKDSLSTIKTFKKFANDDRFKEEKQSSLNRVKEEIEKVRHLNFFNDGMNCILLSFRHFPEMERLYLPRLLNGKFHAELLEFIKFTIHMYSISKQYIPVLYGEQYGNVYLANAILNASKKIASAKIKKDKENRNN
jgi:hypothetical protein